MTADLETNEFIAFSASAETSIRASLAAEVQLMHQYGRVNIANAPAPVVRAAVGGDEAGAAEPAPMTPTEKMGMAAFGLRRTDGYAELKASRPYPGRSWGSEDGEGPLPIHLPDGEEPAPGPPAQASGQPLAARMTGDIALGLVLVSGPSDELAMSEDEHTHVVAEVQNGLSFLADKAPQKDVTFHHEVQMVAVDVPEVTSGSTYEEFEAPWRDAALTHLGFSTGFTGTFEYAEHLRSSMSTDWAYVAFITKYSLRHFAYASLGGPKLTMNYYNDGWGPNQIDRVFAHETGHIFNAPDEYAASQCNCGGAWGFYEKPNSNCAQCAPDGGVKCIMRSNDWSMCDVTPYHLGYNMP